MKFIDDITARVVMCVYMCIVKRALKGTRDREGERDYQRPCAAQSAT